MSIALVSANFGGLDVPAALPPHPGVAALYVTDRADGPWTATWDHVSKPRVSLDLVARPRLLSKAVKCQAYRFAPEAEWIAWADASVEFSDLHFLPAWVERLSGLPEEQRALFVPHPVRATVGEEYRYVIDQLRQRNAYLRDRYTIADLKSERDYFIRRGLDLEALPLWSGGVWLMENSNRTRSFMDAWWHVVSHYCVFDQTALSPCLREAGFQPRALEVHLYRNDLWRVRPHA